MPEYEFLHFPADAVHVDPARYGQLPRSARVVFDAVRERGPLTHHDLQLATGMPSRTVRFAVKRLAEEGLLDRLGSLRDCRVGYVFVHPRCIGADALEAARARAELASRAGRLVERLRRPATRPAAQRLRLDGLAIAERVQA